MELDVSQIKETETKAGDIVVAKYKGMGVHSYILVDINGERSAVCLSGSSNLNGIFSSFDALVEDILNEPLIEEYSIYNSDLFKLVMVEK